MTFINVFIKYFYYISIFLSKFAAKILKYIGICNHVKKLKESKWPYYVFIYSLKQAKLKTLKAYIETNLTKSFIKSFKPPTVIPIF